MPTEPEAVHAAVRSLCDKLNLPWDGLLELHIDPKGVHAEYLAVDANGSPIPWGDTLMREHIMLPMRTPTEQPCPHAQGAHWFGDCGDVAAALGATR